MPFSIPPNLPNNIANTAAAGAAGTAAEYARRTYIHNKQAEARTWIRYNDQCLHDGTMHRDHYIAEQYAAGVPLDTISSRLNYHYTFQKSRHQPKLKKELYVAQKPLPPNQCLVLKQVKGQSPQIVICERKNLMKNQGENSKSGPSPFASISSANAEFSNSSNTVSSQSTFSIAAPTPQSMPLMQPMQTNLMSLLVFGFTGLTVFFAVRRTLFNLIENIQSDPSKKLNFALNSESAVIFLQTKVSICEVSRLFLDNKLTREQTILILLFHSESTQEDAENYLNCLIKLENSKKEFEKRGEVKIENAKNEFEKDMEISVSSLNLESLR